MREILTPRDGRNVVMPAARAGRERGSERGKKWPRSKSPAGSNYKELRAWCIQNCEMNSFLLLHLETPNPSSLSQTPAVRVHLCGNELARHNRRPFFLQRPAQRLPSQTHQRKSWTPRMSSALRFLPVPAATLAALS